MTIVKSKTGFDMTIILTGEESLYDLDVYFTNKASNVIHVSDEGIITILKSKNAQSISSRIKPLSSNEM